MIIQIDHQTTISGCSQGTLQGISERLIFQNPKFLENEKRNFSNWNTDRLLQFYDSVPGGLSFPRGFSGSACRIAKRHGEQITIVDNRRELPAVDFTLTGTLKPFQQVAVKDITAKPFGVLQAPTGSGKTIMALSAIAERKQPALIIVHIEELMTQWIDRIETFLGIPKTEIGVIGGGKMRIGNRITIALIQSLCKYAADVYEYIGFLIVDECHRAPSKTFTDCVSKFDCKVHAGVERDTLAPGWFDPADLFLPGG